jgi:hypothetical protein
VSIRPSVGVVRSVGAEPPGSFDAEKIESLGDEGLDVRSI